MKDIIRRALKSGYDSERVWDALERFINDSSGELARKVLSGDDDYQHNVTRGEQLLDQIRDKLGDEHNLVFELEDAQNLVAEDERFVAYLQGLLDCAAVLGRR